MLKTSLFRLIFLSLIFIGSQKLSADVVSLESNFVPGQADITTKLNNDRLGLTNGVNNIRGVFAGSVQTSGQIKAETVGEENMADDANPRIRTNEGASCADLVYSGLLPTSSSGLIGSFATGTAYPDGYRVEKTDTTAKTFTASKWTYSYICSSGSFSYQEVAIDGSAPATAANCAVLARVSTDASSIISILDLRKTSCAAGPLESISDVTGEATLEQLFGNGIPGRRFSLAGRTPTGFAQGVQVSWDTHTTFKVKSGSLYVNGKYRSVSTDTTVSQTADSPGTGGSGLDTGAIAGSTRYYVYGVADQSDEDGFSISYSTNATSPTGVTNYRLIGAINTDANSLFTSRDVVTAHSISERELIGAWGNFNIAGTVGILNSFNISGITDNGTAGDTTFAFDVDFTSGDAYGVSALAKEEPGTNVSHVCSIADQQTPTLGASIRLKCRSQAAGNSDSPYVSLIATGDLRR